MHLHLQPTRLLEENDNGGFKASRRNAIAKLDWNSSTNYESHTKPARRNCVSDTEYDWETLDDYTTRVKYYEPLAKALSSNGTFDSSVLATISKEFSSGYILHEAIKLLH